MLSGKHLHDGDLPPSQEHVLHAIWELRSKRANAPRATAPRRARPPQGLAHAALTAALGGCLLPWSADTLLSDVPRAPNVRHRGPRA